MIPKKPAGQKMARKIILGVLVLFASAGVATQAVAQASNGTVTSVLDEPETRRLAKQGLDALYDLQFAEAERFFAQIDRRHSDHPVGPFLNSLTTWWEILLDLADTSQDEEFFDAMDEVIERCDRRLSANADDVDARFFKGAALGFRGRLRANRGDWFKAAMDGKKAMDYVLSVPKIDPSNDDYAFGTGIYEYFAAVVPEKHPFVKPVMVFFPKGNRERGLEQITRTADLGYFIQTEAAYFLVQIYYIYERDLTRALEYTQWLRERHPKNAFFHTIEGRIHANRGRWSESKRVFDEVLGRYQLGQTGYNAAAGEQALYYLARERMARRDFDSSVGYLLQLEALAARSDDDSYFKVLGRLRQGMSYDAMGKRELATVRYNEVLQMTDHSGSHARAAQYLKRPFPG